MPFTETHKATLSAIASAFLAPLSKEDSSAIVEEHIRELQDESTREDLESFLQMQTPDLGITEAMVSKLMYLPQDKQNDFRQVLDLLATGWGTFLLTGSSRGLPFHELSLAERESALLHLSKSNFSLLRALFRSLKGLVHMNVFATGSTVDGTMNPYWKALQYSGQPDEKPRPPRSHFWQPAFEDVKAMAKEAQGGKIVVETDVVVIGSGAGGGVIAAELAKAGYRVLVLEQGDFHHPSDSNYNESEEYAKQYVDSVFLTSQDNSIQMLAGKTWGGGTAINWLASLRPPQQVLDEWVSKHKLPYFGSQEYQQALNVVCARAGISPDCVKHNVPNQNLLDGCAKLGFHAETIPQNTAGAEHSCGYCSLGCPYGEKQGTHITWLKDAQLAGAKFITGCYVDKITYSSDKIASGVVGTVLHGTVAIEVKATTVVSCCGGINSPALLLRSGLTNRNIGRNMHLHPVTTVMGFMPKQEVKAWEGSIMTSLSDVVSNCHGDGYGARLETPTALLGATSGLLPWRGNNDFMRIMMQAPHLSGIVTIVRDCDSPIQVKLDATGRARVHFQLGKKDAVSMVEGMIASTKILLAQGAIEINTSHLSIPALRLETEQDRSNPLECETTKRWFSQLRSIGIPSNSLAIFSAHQMSSCRMGSSPATGAVNPQGESWEVQGLYVADASIFPTASGVNPMVTTLSMGYSVAQFIKANLDEERTSGRRARSSSSSFWENIGSWFSP
ncbi:unnamed protein product [Aphanomyces euteiches]